MRCPFCSHQGDRVVDSRTIHQGESIRRRRECSGCGRRFTTYERIEESFPQIVKRDGAREDYDRQKVLRGLRLACAKRSISVEELEEVVEQLEEKLLALGQKEVDADWVGSTITAQLRSLDPVAYIRFASVYHAFDDIQQFLRELQSFESEDIDARRSRGDEAPGATSEERASTGESEGD